MNVIRQTIKAHTIDEWFAIDPSIRPVILQNIKLRDRLLAYLKAETEKPRGVQFDPFWAPCLDCEARGHVLVKPRAAGLHPSGIAKPCLLAIYNEMEGKIGKEKVEPRQKITFDIGHAVHRMLQHYGLKGAWGKLHYQPEVTVSEEYQELARALMIEGHADADNILVIDDIPNAPIFEVGIVHEYKTINSNQFKQLSKPKPEHRQQAMIYAAALNRPVVGYLYVCKDDSNTSDYPVEFDVKTWKTVENKMKILVDHYERNVPPEATTGYHCQQCSYVFDCEPYKKQVLKKG